MDEWKDLSVEEAEKCEWREARKVMKQAGISGSETSTSSESHDEKELEHE